MRKSALHQPVQNITALWAIFSALATFFFTLSASIATERMSASMVSYAQIDGTYSRLVESAAKSHRSKITHQSVRQMSMNAQTK